MYHLEAYYSSLLAVYTLAKSSLKFSLQTLLLSGGYQVKLDHRNLRTPMQKMFLVPSRPLALAVAHEWEAQEAFVQPALMHLVRCHHR